MAKDKAKKITVHLRGGAPEAFEPVDDSGSTEEGFFYVQQGNVETLFTPENIIKIVIES